MDYFIKRRDFLKLAGAFTSTCAFGGWLSGCAWYYTPSSMRKVTKGFNVYNGFNPYVKGRQTQTYLDNIVEHQIAWAGTQYSKSLYEPVIAPARARVDSVLTIHGYHGLETDIRMSHGGDFYTRFYHLKPNSAVVTVGQIVERGAVIAHTGQGIPFKTNMNFNGNMGDLDDYGYNMRFMKPWDGSEVDHNFSEVDERKKMQVKLIDEMRSKYIGPGFKEMENTLGGIPKVCSHDGDGYFLWTHSIFFKMMEHIYNSHPELYKGTRNENNQLIKDIYENQPVILTLPFKIS